MTAPFFRSAILGIFFYKKKSDFIFMSFIISIMRSKIDLSWLASPPGHICFLFQQVGPS